jgi:signal peptidase I
VNRILVPLLLILSVLALLKLFVFEVAEVRGNDMAPALVEGDLVLLSQVATPARGDVIVFEHPEQPGRMALRRVVGVPGDAVELRGEQVLVNQQTAKQSSGGRMLVRGFQDGKERMMDVIVEAFYGRDWRVLDDPKRRAAAKRKLLGGEGYIVLADNRDHGRDSREFGAVRPVQLRGVALAILKAGVGTSPTIDAQRRDFSKVR